MPHARNKDTTWGKAATIGAAAQLSDPLSFAMIYPVLLGARLVN